MERASRRALHLIGVFTLLIGMACNLAEPTGAPTGVSQIDGGSSSSSLVAGSTLRSEVRVRVEVFDAGTGWTVTESERATVEATVSGARALSNRGGKFAALIPELARNGRSRARAPHRTQISRRNEPAAVGIMQFANDGSPGWTALLVRDGVPVFSSSDEWIQNGQTWQLRKRIFTWTVSGLPARRVVVDVDEAKSLASTEVRGITDGARRMLAMLAPANAYAAVPSTVAARPAPTSTAAAIVDDGGCWLEWATYLGGVAAAEAACVGTAGLGCLAGILLIAKVLWDLDNCLCNGCLEV